jgi:N-acyl-L-homoserine lactone synthetase
MTPLEVPGRWIADRRGQGRGVRVSAHEEAGFLVLSTWKEGLCVGTVRLLPDEAAELVSGVAEALGRLACRPPAEPSSPELTARMALLEERLARLEGSAAPTRLNEA